MTVALACHALLLATLLAVPAAASAQVFLASKPHPPLTVGPLMVRASVTPALGAVTVDVLFSLVVPPGRSAVEFEQDFYVLWPGAVHGAREPRDPALAKFVESRGFDVIEEGTLPLYAQSLYQMQGELPDERLPVGASYVTFVHHVRGLGLSPPGTWIRIPWTPKLVNRAWIIDLRLTVDGLVKPKAANWMERVFSGPRHRIAVAFNDVRGRAVFPLYVEHRDRVLRLSDDPAQIVINFADSARLKIDELAPSVASRQLSETLEATETVSLFLERSEGVTPQVLTVQFGYFTGLQNWAPILIPVLFFVAGNVAGVLVRNLAEYLSRRLSGRLQFVRAQQPAERTSGVVVPRETLARITPGETTYEELVRIIGVSPEEFEQLDGSGRRTLIYRGRRLVPHLKRRLGWFSTLSHWDAEDHEVEVQVDGGIVRDVQARIRRSRVRTP
jgi:hypothetical protein